MYLRKRKNGVYYIIYGSSNRMKSTGSNKRNEALKIMGEFQMKAETRLSSSAELPFLKVAAKYLNYSEIYHAKLTTRDYRITFKNFQKHIGKLTIGEINSSHIQDYINFRILNSSIHQGRKDTINLKAFFNWAHKENFISTNPAETIKRLKAPEKLPVFLLLTNSVNSLL